MPRIATAVVRWVLAPPASMVVFHPLVLFLILLGSVTFGRSWPELHESSPISLGVLLFALASYIAILAGATVAPHRYWKLATGILSFNLMLPGVALCIDDIRTTGEAGFRNGDFGGIFGVAVGAFLAYWTLRHRWRGRIDTSHLSNRTRIAIVAACAIVFLLPLRSVTVPPWRVQFVDEQGQALSGLKINQHWVDFFAWQSVGVDDIRITDETGVVAFPERVVLASLALRLWGPIRDTVDSLVSPAFVPYAELTTLCPMHALEREGTYYTGTSLATQLHLTEGEERSPHPAEYDSSCQRLIDQVRRARSPR
jgi:hypothetical protein